MVAFTVKPIIKICGSFEQSNKLPLLSQFAFDIVIVLDW
jgi:hypothetical protein